jgi:hypothetical protein
MPAAKLPTGLRIASIVLRAVFIGALMAIILRVSMPQTASIWSLYETPGDLIRMGLGVAVCVWIVSQFFMAPYDAQSQRTWFYLGLVAVPFALICLIAVW